MRAHTIFALALCGGIGLSGAASAQSTGAPAGVEAATAPGGTEGAAGARNEREAIKSGDAIPAPPSRGIEVDAPPQGERPPSRAPQP